MWKRTPLRELPLSGMNEPHSQETSEAACVHVDDAHKRSSTPDDHESERSANGFEIWRRFVEDWEPAHRGRYRAMLMHLLQFPFAGDRG